MADMAQKVHPALHYLKHILLRSVARVQTDPGAIRSTPVITSQNPIPNVHSCHGTDTSMSSDYAE